MMIDAQRMAAQYEAVVAYWQDAALAARQQRDLLIEAMGALTDMIEDETLVSIINAVMGMVQNVEQPEPS